MMHKQYKRILSCLVAAGLMAGSVSGCGLVDKVKTTVSDAKSAVVEKEDTKTEDTKEETQDEAADADTATQDEGTDTASQDTDTDAASQDTDTDTASQTADAQGAETATEDITPEVVVERQEVDTSSMIPVEYTTEEGSIGLYVPEGWIYRIDIYEGSQNGFSISIQPDGEEGDIMLSFMADGTLVTTADNEIGAEMYGYTGYQGTYDTASVWSYFRCDGNNGSYEICNNAGDFWWADQEDTVNQILSTMSLDTPLIGSAKIETLGEAFDVNGKNVTVNLEGAAAESTVEGTTEAEEYVDGDIDDNGADYGAVTITCDEQILALDDACYGTRAIDVLPVSDTVSYILVETVHENDYTDLYLVKADTEAEETLALCDSLDAAISDTEEVTTSGFALEFRVNCMGTYGGNRHYTIYQDKFYTNDTQLHFDNASGSHMDIWSNTEGMDGESLDNLSKLYTEDGRMCLTTKADVKAYTSGGDEITIPAGTQICPTDVDLDAHMFYFDFIDQDEVSGEYLTNYGYISYDTDESGYQITVDGVDQYELFETLPYAG